VNDILDVSAGILESRTKSLQPDMVTKESLQHSRVLQQVDTKFIAIVTQNVLLLVDQVCRFIRLGRIWAILNDITSHFLSR
jgi:hypothetical protein